MPQVSPETPPEYDRTRLIERPDGFYWQSKDDGREYGPFASLLEAVLDMQLADEAAIEPGETVEEARSEIGIAGWVDPETGEPAEETVTRIEEH
jgi:hypothetical protein